MVIAANLIKENEIKELRPNSGSCHNMTKNWEINTILCKREITLLQAQSLQVPTTYSF